GAKSGAKSGKSAKSTVSAPTGLLGHVPLGLDTADDDARGAHPAARARARRDPRIAAAPTHPGPGPGEYLPGEQRRLGTIPRRHTDVRRLLLGLVLRDLPAADDLPRRLHHSPHEAALEGDALGAAEGAAATE